MDTNSTIATCAAILGFAIWIRGWPQLITINKITKNVYLKGDKDTTKDK